MSNSHTSEFAIQKQNTSSEKSESELKQFEKLLDRFFAATGI